MRSEGDRPDSGFDSKDGEEEERSREEGSPEVSAYLPRVPPDTVSPGRGDVEAGRGQATCQEEENVLPVLSLTLTMMGAKLSHHNKHLRN